MNITITEDKLKGLTAKVEQLNAAAIQAAAASCDLPKPDPDLTTTQAFLEARIDELLASYDQQLIAEVKRQFDDVITIAATLTPEKQAILVAQVQELAAS